MRMRRGKEQQPHWRRTTCVAVSCLGGRCPRGRCCPSATRSPSWSVCACSPSVGSACARRGACLSVHPEQPHGAEEHSRPLLPPPLQRASPSSGARAPHSGLATGPTPCNSGAACSPCPRACYARASGARVEHTARNAGHNAGRRLTSPPSLAARRAAARGSASCASPPAHGGACVRRQREGCTWSCCCAWCTAQRSRFSDTCLHFRVRGLSPGLGFARRPHFATGAGVAEFDRWNRTIRSNENDRNREQAGTERRKAGVARVA